MQAKRRAHAVVIDHLVPPMMRAETYDELAQLEQLLDEYARCEALDPAKLPDARATASGRCCTRPTCTATSGSRASSRRWRTSATLIEHVDGYLCEIKDLQVRDGLHILGAARREGEQLRGLLRRDHCGCHGACCAATP